MDSRTAPSTFVAVVGWIGVLCGAYGIPSSIMQYVMFAAMPPMKTPPSSTGVDFLFSHMGLFLAAQCALVVVLLVTSMGLLRRKNWARRTFVVLLLGAIAWGGMFAVTTPLLHHEPLGDDAFDRVFRVMSYYVLLVGVSTVALLAWVIARLCSKRVRDEFSAHAATPTS